MKIKGGSGAKIIIEFSEALYNDAEKGARNNYTAKEFRGIGDEYIADGSMLTLSPLWWLSGRYIKITVNTYDEPLQICSFSINETHYPLICDRIDKVKLSDSEKIMLRTLEMCMQDVYKRQSLQSARLLNTLL